MELLIMDVDFVSIAVIDNFKSLLWTERYNSFGDFEIETLSTKETLDILKPGYFIRNQESDYIMVIEDVEIKFDSDDGYILRVTGRSAESLLDRRIIWNQTTISGSLQDGIETLLNENVISPTDTDRTIDTISFEASSDTNITSLTVEAQYIRDNLYDVIEALCTTENIGFIMLLNDTYDQFIFQLYAGVDRSFAQENNPYVVFSKGFENLLSSEYANRTENYKNVTLVSGEGDEADKLKKTVGAATGIDRRELHTDASGISREVDGSTIPEVDYLAQLEQKGLEELTINSIDMNFDATIDIEGIFKYNQDFFLGDIVQIVSEYNGEEIVQARARITEIIRSQSTSGIDICPKFEIIE